MFSIKHFKASISQKPLRNHLHSCKFFNLVKVSRLKELFDCLFDFHLFLKCIAILQCFSDSLTEFHYP